MLTSTALSQATASPVIATPLPTPTPTLLPTTDSSQVLAAIVDALYELSSQANRQDVTTVVSETRTLLDRQTPG